MIFVINWLCYNDFCVISISVAVIRINDASSDANRARQAVKHLETTFVSFQMVKTLISRLFISVCCLNGSRQ